MFQGFVVVASVAQLAVALLLPQTWQLLLFLLVLHGILQALALLQFLSQLCEVVADLFDLRALERSGLCRLARGRAARAGRRRAVEDCLDRLDVGHCRAMGLRGLRRVTV